MAEPIKIDKLSNKIFDDLVSPRFPKETAFELRERYWALAGDPAAHLQFTIIPDEDTRDAIKYEMETIIQAGSMEGFELITDVLELEFIDKLMMLKSLTYTDTPNLMDRLTGSMPSIKMSDADRKADNQPLLNVGDRMMNMISQRRY